MSAAAIMQQPNWCARAAQAQRGARCLGILQSAVPPPCATAAGLALDPLARLCALPLLACSQAQPQLPRRPVAGLGGLPAHLLHVPAH